MKVTAFVTVSLAAMLIFLELDPTTGIRLGTQYGGKSEVTEGGGGGSGGGGVSGSRRSEKGGSNEVLPSKLSSSSRSSSGSRSSRSDDEEKVGMRSGGGGSLSPSVSSRKEGDVLVKSSVTKRGKLDSLLEGRGGEEEEEDARIEQILESWRIQPPHFWNYLPHTNSIGHHDVVGGGGVLSRSHSHGKGRSKAVTELGGEESRDEGRGVEDEEELNNDINEGLRGVGAGKGGGGSRDNGFDGSSGSSHHLSFLPDPHNLVSIDVPTNELLGQRLAALNAELFRELSPPGQDGRAEGEDENPGEGARPSHFNLASSEPSLSLLKRTSSSSLHSSAAAAGESVPGSPDMGNRKTEDRKRANRQYDVPQIECPPADDGMERFACPSPDRQGRYRCIDDHVLCDGFVDCPKEEDEDRHACMFYKTTKAHLDVLADALLRWARGRR